MGDDSHGPGNVSDACNAACDRDGCDKPPTGYDAWGQWCDEHNGGLTWPSGRAVGQLGQPGHLEVSERDDAAVAEADGDVVAVGRLDDLADDAAALVVVEGDPLAGAMLHNPKSTDQGWPLTGLCGICGQTVGCECAA